MNLPTIDPRAEKLSYPQVASELQRLRDLAPLVHVMTNEVVQEFTANVLLAIGAAPAMIVAEQEAGEFAAIASALLINLGTVYPERLKAMQLAIASANKAGTPWVLDPVAVGVLSYRSQIAKDLLALKPAAIRGNASEILALAGLNGGGRGVDSTASAASAIDAAMSLARDTGAIVAVTGEVDYITDGTRLIATPWGHVRMTRVVGTGCSLSALVAAFLTDAPDRLSAVAGACAVMGICGERAFDCSEGTGSFHMAFLDALSVIQPAQLQTAEDDQ